MGSWTRGTRFGRGSVIRFILVCNSATNLIPVHGSRGKNSQKSLLFFNQELYFNQVINILSTKVPHAYDIKSRLICL